MEAVIVVNWKLVTTILAGLLFCWGCDDNPVEPEEIYHDIRYAVSSSGDTTQVIYRDQNGKDQSVTIAHDTRIQVWEVKFKAKEGSDLWIFAESWGKGLSGVRLVSVSVFIFVDGGSAVAQNGVDADKNECSCVPIQLTDWCLCMASASAKI